MTLVSKQNTIFYKTFHREVDIIFSPATRIVFQKQHETSDTTCSEPKIVLGRAKH